MQSMMAQPSLLLCTESFRALMKFPATLKRPARWLAA